MQPTSNRKWFGVLVAKAFSLQTLKTKIMKSLFAFIVAAWVAHIEDTKKSYCILPSNI